MEALTNIDPSNQYGEVILKTKALLSLSNDHRSKEEVSYQSFGFL